MASRSMPSSRMRRSAFRWSRGSEEYSRGLASSLRSGKRCDTRPTPASTRPARRPQHSFGCSARACPTRASYSSRGKGEDLERIKQKALKTGAVDAVVSDARNMFVDYFVFPSLMAGAVYEGKYPLATALGRPLIAKLMVETAHEHKARAVAHGCTGKGNDQVRFDVTFQTLDSSLKIIAPVREWSMTRPESLKFAAKHNIPVEATVESPYSIDQNLWGRSCEAGVLEDPWDEPPAGAFAWTTDPAKAPNEPEYVEIEFEHGRPVALNGQRLDGVPLISRLNEVGGKHGVGRIDHVVNRLVGIKSRELYEAPA